MAISSKISEENLPLGWLASEISVTDEPDSCPSGNIEKRRVKTYLYKISILLEFENPASDKRFSFKTKLI